MMDTMQQLGEPWPRDHSDVFATFGAEDVIFACQETSSNQGNAAMFAVEAVIVPLALIK